MLTDPESVPPVWARPKAGEYIAQRALARARRAHDGERPARAQIK